MNKLTIIFTEILFLLLTFSCFSQEKSTSSLEKYENNYNRSRLLFGYTTLLIKNTEPSLNSMFLNLNHRTSRFNRFTKPFRFEFAFEYGINGIIVNDREWEGIFFIPYGKAGPVMSMFKNSFIGASGGLATTIMWYFAIIPFAGFNTYYLLPLNKKLILEIELGYHTTFFLENQTPYMVYFTTGIAIR